MQARDTSTKGDSAGQLPSQVKSKKTETKLQKIKREIGENWNPLKKWFFLLIPKRNKTKKALAIRTTPPNLLGIERRIA